MPIIQFLAKMNVLSVMTRPKQKQTILIFCGEVRQRHAILCIAAAGNYCINLIHHKQYTKLVSRLVPQHNSQSCCRKRNVRSFLTLLRIERTIVHMLTNMQTIVNMLTESLQFTP